LKIILIKLYYISLKIARKTALPTTSIITTRAVKIAISNIHIGELMNDDSKLDRHPANADIDVTIDDKNKISDVTKSTFNPKKLHSKIKNNHPLTKKEKWIVAGEITVIIILIAFIVFIFTRHTKPPVVVHKVVKAKTVAKVITSRLTGLPVTAAQAALPVTGVMIENSDAARPQSGLSQAGVVFEALAEGGITRFLALYEEGQPSSIGPVRSARPYFIDWLLPFNAAYAHVGGSPTALSDIQNLGIRDMDQFTYSSTYTRITSRQAPHNVYTSMSDLLALETSKGWTTSNFTGFPRKPDDPSKTPTATNINLNIAGSDMDVVYQYNSKLNNYSRSEGGAPMIDANTGKQLTPKVVIAMVVPWTDGPIDASGAYYTEYSDIGSGTAYIFQDGTVTAATWSKLTQSSQIQFNNASTGSIMKLDAGQTWITAVGASNLVSYST
jgi:hypothetical protein